MTRKPFAPQGVAATGAPYSPGLEFGDLVFTSGQVPIDPETGKLSNAAFADQVRLALNNVDAVLRAGGSDLAHALKVTVYLTDMARFGEMNEVYKTFFSGSPPVRTCIEVGALPFGAEIEVEAIGCKSGAGLG
jgi:2-iminobutanoate/2-iminopropanoate deaminase